MEFVRVILQNSNLMEAKLFNAAQKAYANPEIGIVIENKAAYHVIKDCAGIAVNYLPLFVFGSYEEPFKTLKGKFTKESIAEFVKSSDSSLPMRQLLNAILYQVEIANARSTKTSRSKKKIEVAPVESSANPYGDYGSDLPASSSNQSDSTLSPYDILCKCFAAT